jgi:hypothetical protein
MLLAFFNRYIVNLLADSDDEDDVQGSDGDSAS